MPCESGEESISSGISSQRLLASSGEICALGTSHRHVNVLTRLESAYIHYSISRCQARFATLTSWGVPPPCLRFTVRTMLESRKEDKLSNVYALAIPRYYRVEGRKPHDHLPHFLHTCILLMWKFPHRICADEADLPQHRLPPFPKWLSHRPVTRRHLSSLRHRKMRCMEAASNCITEWSHNLGRTLVGGHVTVVIELVTDLWGRSLTRKHLLQPKHAGLPGLDILMYVSIQCKLKSF